MPEEEAELILLATLPPDPEVAEDVLEAVEELVDELVIELLRVELAGLMAPVQA